MALNTNGIILEKTITWDCQLFNAGNNVTRPLYVFQRLSGKTWEFLIKNYLLIIYNDSETITGMVT